MSKTKTIRKCTLDVNFQVGRLNKNRSSLTGRHKNRIFNRVLTFKNGILPQNQLEYKIISEESVVFKTKS